MAAHYIYTTPPRIFSTWKIDGSACNLPWVIGMIIHPPNLTSKKTNFGSWSFPSIYIAMPRNQNSSNLKSIKSIHPLRGGTKVGDRMLDVKVGLRTKALTVSPSCKPTSARVELPLSTWECDHVKSYGKLTSWWLNQPFWKMCESQIGSFSQGSGWKYFFIWNHQPVDGWSTTHFSKNTRLQCAGELYFYNISDFSKGEPPDLKSSTSSKGCPGSRESDNVSFPINYYV